MNVFFYGLFMDEALLASKGISVGNTSVGQVDGFVLRIGARATLLPSEGARAYGVVMTISENEADDLYADSSVADYVPEPVIVELPDGRTIDAVCYNLPADKVAGTNKAYAKSLIEVATELGLPDAYLDEIRSAG